MFTTLFWFAESTGGVMTGEAGVMFGLVVGALARVVVAMTEGTVTGNWLDI
jgi:hypothetical protein